MLCSESVGMLQPGQIKTLWPKNVSQTIDNMRTIFWMHEIRLWNHESQAQSQDRECWPNGPIHGIWIELATPKHICVCM